MSRDISGATDSNSSSVMTTTSPESVSYPRTRSSCASFLPSFEHRYCRPSAWPSLSTIFIDVCRGRVPENRSTGMLTSPNVIVPDQKERTGAGPAPESLPFPLPLLDRLGNFLLPRLREARFQGIRETRFRRFALALDRRDLLAVQLRVDQGPNALAVLVLPLLGLEVTADRRDELLSELQLAGLRRVGLRDVDVRKAQHLFGAPERRHHEVAVIEMQRAQVSLLAHSPARDPDELLLAQRV